jgi:nucleotide-binding universal stress UspA family protein
MIKRILVATDGSEQATLGVHYAVALASKCQAHLTGLHVVDVKLLEGPFLRDISASLGTAPYVNYQNNIALILEERGRAALAAVQTACADAGISCDTELATGAVPRTILEHAELADMVILGRAGEHSEWLDGVVGSTTAAVARRASQPVLVTGRRELGGTRFVVAYDGSQHAKRALKAAVQLSPSWMEHCHILIVGEAQADALREEIAAYLRAHDLNHEIVVRDGDPSEVIVTYASESGADLLVMGAYGHTKVRELVVGSTTAYALNHATCPLLLCR